MFKRLLFAPLLFLTVFIYAQSPVSWTFQVKPVDDCHVDFIYKATIQSGWYVYSQYLPNDNGPVATTVNYEQKDNVELVGKATESGHKVEGYDDMFDMNITKFKEDYTITQRVKVKSSKAVKGYLNYMTCDARQCMPPKDVDFSFDVKANPTCGAAPTNNSGNNGGTATSENGVKGDIKNPANSGVTTTASASVTATNNTGVTATQVPTAVENKDTTKTTEVFKGAEGMFEMKDGVKTFNPRREKIDVDNPVARCGETKESDGVFWKFVLGFIGGLAALLTPCVFPMIPLTVSFFTKRSKDRKTGIRNAIIYGLSIIGIYTSMGLAITAFFGASALNTFATHWVPNVFFFVIIGVFALSFLGFFELTLPASWTTKTDNISQKGGLMGIFFMAFTLSLVSFSCTGPIIGTVLTQVLSNPLGPTMAMLGFSTALALPFALFSAFPGWLNSVPKSGGWMNDFKVTLGLFELALAFKFFSTADLTRHWHILQYEIFIGAWALICLAGALYYFKILRFPVNKYDEKGIRPTVTQWILGGLFLALTVYLALGLRQDTENCTYRTPGLTAGFAPPADSEHTLFLNCESHCPAGLPCFHDYNEGLAYAQSQNKMVMVDFTGYGCVNCRKMEQNVWIYPEIYTLLKTILC